MGILEAVQKGGFLHSKNAKGQTLLHFAISEGDPKMVKELINSGANLHITNDESGETPLEMAINEEDTYDPRNCPENELEIIREIMEGLFQELVIDSANISKGDSYGMTLLHYAIAYGTTEFIKKLIKKGADVNAEDKRGYTPLMHAAEFNDDPEVVKELIANGAIAKGTNNNLNTPLSLGISFNNSLEIIQILLQNGAIDNNANEMLHLAACECKYPEIIIEIIKNYKADVNAVDERKETALFLTVKYSDNAVDVSIKILQALLDLGANVNAINNEGQTALHIALKEKKIEHAICLINNNASLSMRDNNNKTPLDYLDYPINPQIQKALEEKSKKQSEPNPLVASIRKDKGGSNDLEAMATAPISRRPASPASPANITNEGPNKKPKLR